MVDEPTAAEPTEIDDAHDRLDALMNFVEGLELRIEALERGEPPQPKQQAPQHVPRRLDPPPPTAAELERRAQVKANKEFELRARGLDHLVIRS
jgi:hypothetical protein